MKNSICGRLQSVALLIAVLMSAAGAVAQTPAIPVDIDPIALPQEPERASGVSTNLTITGAAIIDGAFNPITPQAGVPFFVRVDFNYIAPTDCTPYQISREINGWLHEPNPVTFGCDTGGGVGFFFAAGSMVLFESGSYTATLTIDAQGAISEADESDNTFIIDFDVPGVDIEPPEWQLTGAAAGRALLGDGTDVIVGTMDDAFDYLHPWYAGNDSLGSRSGMGEPPRL